MSNLRRIASAAQGERRGPISCLIDPEGNGDSLKPFIFLDFFEGEITPGFSFRMHPHSGIGTLTWQPGCDVEYEDNTGKKGLLKADGLEWMLSGRGAWHQAKLLGSGPAIGFALWVALPPIIEDGPALGQYVPPEEVPILSIAGGQIKVLLGSLHVPPHTARSSIDTHQDMNYLVVSLEKGSTWTYDPPSTHNVAFAFSFEGTATIQGKQSHRLLLGFKDEPGSIELFAPNEAVQILLGSARKHDFPLVLGTSSVHTNEVSLASALSYIHSTRPKTT